MEQKQKSIWTWLKENSKLREQLTRTGFKTKTSSQSSTEEENPWLNLRAKKSVSALSSRWNEAPTPPSLYGFVDEDGTLRQIDTAAWEKTFTKPRVTNSKRFVPVRATPTSATPATSTSRWMWQFIIAVVVVASGIYAHHGTSPAATKLFNVYQYTFGTDYTEKTWPVISNYLVEHHIAIPTFGSTASIALHQPLAGKIVADYSRTNHPEIWIQGSASEAVLAAGSGIVKSVHVSGTTSLVELDVGRIGTMMYAGLGQVSVKVGESVYGGEIIGRLPSASSAPTLRFSMSKDGQFENPHDFIHFA